MSDYTTFAVAWSGKDALSDSAPGKVISGSDFHSEFTAVQTAVNSKADLNGSATETFSAVTAAVGTNTTQVATTAFVDAAIDAIATAYPVGSIYMNASVSTNPATLLGMTGTTWVSFGAGRMPIGLDSSDTDFDTVEETGGAKTHTLTVDEMPAHTHDYTAHLGTGASGPISLHDRIPSVTGPTTSTGGGSAHNNMPPYITVYMWKRTA